MANLCPVARAIRRQTGRRMVAVCRTEILIGKKKIITPAAVAKFVREFDDKKSVKPFAFDLEIG